MKDTIITVRQKKRELFILLLCYIVANIINIIGIVKYHTSWKELYSAQLWVLAVTGVLYATGAVFRIVWWLVKRIARRPED